jgi:hypothetical protein
MGFFDQYKSINRSTITNAGKTGTRERLDESFANPQWKDDAIQVVKKLLEFKVEQSRDVTAERLLGDLTTPLERLNAKRRQAGAVEIAERELHELVRNRSAIFKRQLPDTFKGLLRTWLRDGPAKAILVNTNTAAFLKSNDLITAAEVRTATPEAAFSRQLFNNDVAAMLNGLEKTFDDTEGMSKTKCASFTVELKQAVFDYNRLRAFPPLREFAERSLRHVIRTCARASATGGLNRQQLLKPQANIRRTKVADHAWTHEWTGGRNRKPMQIGLNWVIDGLSAGNVTTGLRNYEWMQDARLVFGPEIFEFGEHVSFADGLAAPETRRSQRLLPDEQYIGRQNFGSYARDFLELRGARGFHFAADPLDDRALDTFDMLVTLCLNQSHSAYASRFKSCKWEQEHARVPAAEFVNATRPDGVPYGNAEGQAVAYLFTREDYWHYPIRISTHSREVEFLEFRREGIAVPGIAGAPQQFWPYKTFTTRFSWCERTNFVTSTVIDETPWKCSSHRPEWVPPSRRY